MPQPQYLLPEALSLDAILEVACVRATDRTISTVVWRNPDPNAINEIFVLLPELTPQHLVTLGRRIGLLLVSAQSVP